MLRKLFCLTAAAAGLWAQTTAPKKPAALDKAALEAYVRHLFVIDNRVKVEVQDPKPSPELPGFNDVTVRASAGQQVTDIKLFVSKDGSRIIQGSVYESANNPFKADLDKLKTDGAPNFGTQGAPVVIVEFSDFECPYCKEEASMLRANIPAGFSKQVHVYFMPFPLENIHPWAKPAAIAGMCVAKQNNDTFWAYHDWIFLHQADITPGNFREQATEWAKLQQGLDTAALGTCMDTQATWPQIEKFVAMARSVNVGQTPTLFVNGRRMEGAADWPSLKAVIENEIEYQKTAKNAGEDCGCTVNLSLPGLKK